MTPMRPRVLVTLSAATLLASCASIVHGSRQDIGITSTPAAARVTVDGQLRGTTPLVVPLPRKRPHALRVELDGYQPYTVTLTRKTSGWVWGNLLFGALVGLAVDASTGAMYRLTPEQVQAQIGTTRTGSRSRVTTDGVYVFLVTGGETSWERVAQLGR